MATASYTLPNPPFFLQRETGQGDPIYYDAEDFTRFFTGILPRSGILGSSHFLVSQAANVGMAIKVNSGYANVGGRYLAHLGADQTIDLSSFTGNPSATRTHKVYLSVYNGLENGLDWAAKIDVMEDTGSGAATPPTANAYLQLATITVAPGQGMIQNANINNTVRRGGVAGEYVPLAPYLDGAFLSAADVTDAHEFRARYENGRVFLSGVIRRSTGAAFAAATGYDIGVMHSNLRPARTVFLTGATSINSTGDPTGSYGFRLSIAKDGVMNVRLPTGTSPLYLFFDGLTYDLD